MEIFEFDQYRNYILDKISTNTHVKGYRKLLAEAAGCSSAFLSQVLTSHIHLTPDHAAGLVLFWELGSLESEYFIQLVMYERAASKNLKQYLETQIRKLKNERYNIGKRLEKESHLSTESKSVYYESWLPAAVHIALSIDEFSDVRSLSKKLKVDENQIMQTLHKLEKMGLVQKDKSWKITENQIHISKDSPFSNMHHSNWRHILLAKQKSDGDSSMHYTGVYATDAKTALEIKERVFQTIKANHQDILKSNEEELYCLCLDFFAPF